MKIAQEEIFGPVLAVLTFDDVERLLTRPTTILMAGRSSLDQRREESAQVSRQLRAGTVWINTYGLMDASLPFGGYKSSGFGRELGCTQSSTTRS